MVVHKRTLRGPPGPGLPENRNGLFRKRNYPTTATFGLKVPISPDNLGRTAPHVHCCMPLITAVLPPKVNQFFCPQPHVGIQADQEQQVVKLVVPPIPGMALMMGLNLLEEFALMLLPHGLRGPFDLFREGYLLGQILVHRALLDEIPKQVPEVLDVLPPGGIGQVIAGHPLIEPVGDVGRP